jgi:CheY-like chemotaxis protein
LTPADFPYKAVPSMAVLIVDDDYDLRESLVGLLEGAGYRALEASSAEEAVDLIIADPDTIRLVLLDYCMPGMDGWQLAEMMGADIPIVAMTASSEANKPPNAVGMLKKPFDIDQLFSAVRDSGAELPR